MPVSEQLSRIRPSELPYLRDRLKQWLARHGQAVINSYAEHVEHGDLAALYSPICSTAASARLYCVAPDMLELALQAATPSIESLNISAHDLPSNMGMVCFAVPIRIDRSFGQSTPICGALWFRWLSGGYDTVTLVWLTDRYNPAFEWFLDVQGNPVNPAFTTSFRSVTADDWRGAGDFRLAIHGMDNLAVGIDNPPLIISPNELVDANMRSDRAVLKAIWLLMSQTLAEVDVCKVGPPLQKKRGRNLPRPEVRVIKLRRPPGGSGGGPGDREWRHRWIVRGHWRMQPWGPKRERVRPVWIAPHLKGPEGKPMLGGEKVYHLAR